MRIRSPEDDPLPMLLATQGPSAPIVRPSLVSLALDGAAVFTEPCLGVELDAETGNYAMKIVDCRH